MRCPTIVLAEFLEKGFLIHGSSRFIEGNLKPHRANYVTELAVKKEKQMLLYATDFIETAIGIAVSHPGKGKSKLWTAESPETGRVIRWEGKNIVFGTGYIYVLPSVTFYRVSGVLGTFASNVAVEPMSRIEVNYKHFAILQKQYGFQVNYTP